MCPDAGEYQAVMNWAHERGNWNYLLSDSFVILSSSAAETLQVFQLEPFAAS